MKITSKILFAIFNLFSVLALAAAPDWSVNSSSFSNSMTATVALNVNCTLLENPSNKIGAFVNGVSRGEALTSVVVAGKYIALMNIYSNVTSGETVTFKIYNATTDTEIAAFTTVLFQNDATFGTPSSPFEIVTNQKPSKLDLNPLLIQESTSVQTVGDFVTTDADAADTYIYSLIGGVGSNHNSSFSITGNQLFTSGVINFEIAANYKIRVKASDGKGCTIEDTFALEVQNKNDSPNDLLLSANTIKENLTSTELVGDLSSVDLDNGQTFTYSLAAGTGDADNASFVLNGNKLFSKKSFDYETQNSYKIRLRTTDNLGAFFEKEFELFVLNQNDAPTEIALSKLDINENKAIGSQIGTLSTTDQDVSNTFTYTILSGSESFLITGNTLVSNVIFDFETQSSYFFTLRTEDGKGGIFEKQFNIAINDANDAPSDVALDNLTIDEDQAIGTVIGNVSSTDIDAGATFTYTLVAGLGATNNTSFIITGSELKSNAIFDYSTTKNLSVRIKTTDNVGLSFEKVFAIAVNDLNDAPTNIHLSATSMVENLALETIIGNLSSVDSDLNDSFTYSLAAGGTDNLLFVLVDNTLKTNSLFDFETKNSYEIKLKTEDAQGASFEKTFIIKLTNQNEKPSQFAISNSSVEEGLALGTLIGTFTSQDPDANDNFSYALLSINNNDVAKFAIDGDKLISSEVFDFESKANYNISVRTTDAAGLYIDKQLTITILDKSDAPTDIAISNDNVDEDKAIAAIVGTFTSKDLDANEVFAYSLVSGIGSENNASFTIDADVLKTNAVFDFTTNKNLKIRVKTTDKGGLSFEKALVIKINDVNDAPYDLSISTDFINENAAISTVIGMLSSKDYDAGTTFTYSLVAGTGDTDNASFTIVGNELKSKSIFDFETKSGYSVRVQTNDGAASFEKVLTIAILNTNDKPIALALGNNSVDENTAIGTEVGQLSTNDVDANDSHTYSLVSVNNNDVAKFIITGDRILIAESFNFETKNIYNITIKTTDAAGLSFEQQLGIVVNDANDTPTDVLLSSTEVEEEQVAGEVVAIFSSSDVDASNTFVYSLLAGIGAADNAKFTIVGDTLKTAEKFDYTFIKSLKIRVQTEDNIGGKYAKSFVISVLDINDAPTNISLSKNQLKENSELGTTIGLFSTTDQDPKDAFTYSLVAGIDADDNTSFLIEDNQLKVNAAFDFETKNTFKIRLKSIDASGTSVEIPFVVLVLDANDAPTDILLSTTDFMENRKSGARVCTLSTIDQDLSNTHRYSFENIQGNDNASFTIFGNELRSSGAFDFETKAQYNIALKTIDPFGREFIKQFIISILDSNDVPLAIALDNNTIDEKLAAGSLIGALSTDDIDAVDVHNYSLANGKGGEDNALFTINGNHIVSTAIFDFNTKNSYKILVKSTDKGGLSINTSYQIQVLDVNIAPTDVSVSNLAIDENKAKNTFIGIISVADEDVNDAFIFNLTSGIGGEDNTSFKIKNDSIFSSKIFDFESKFEYTIRVKVTDKSSNTYEEVVLLTIKEVNEAPVGEDAIVEISEKAEKNMVLGSVVASDVDANQLSTFAILPTAESKNFAIVAATGEISYLTGALNYETKNKYIVQVVVTDNGTEALSDTVEVIINVTDEIEGTLPSADYLSPNGDGKNDTWVVENVDLYTNYTLKIFTASGNLIYETKSYDNTWNGTFEGKELPTGAYFYLFSNSSSDKNYKGTISIVR